MRDAMREVGSGSRSPSCTGVHQPSISHPHERNLCRWSPLVNAGDLGGLRRVLIGLDRESIEMREISRFGGLLSPDERAKCSAAGSVMRRDQLEHAIRTACQIIGAPEVIVVGSQSILGSYREERLPAAATMSVEIDILPIADANEETARLPAAQMNP